MGESVAFFDADCLAGAGFAVRFLAVDFAVDVVADALRVPGVVAFVAVAAFLFDVLDRLGGLERFDFVAAGVFAVVVFFAFGEDACGVDALPAAVGFVVLLVEDVFCADVLDAGFFLAAALAVADVVCDFVLA